MKTHETKWWHRDWLNKRIVRARIRRFIRESVSNGRIKAPVLDAGCGYRTNYPEVRHDPYSTLDNNPDLPMAARSHVHHYVADVMDMTSVVPKDYFRTVIMTEVLEHLPEPKTAVVQAWEVLRSGGRLVVTVPFWFPIHEKPWQRDYWRFTLWGLHEVLKAAPFTVRCVDPVPNTARPSTICGVALK